MKQHFRVTFRRTQCRDVFVEAENDKDALELAKNEDWENDDWCDGDGHDDGLADLDIVKVDKDGEEIE